MLPVEFLPDLVQEMNTILKNYIAWF